MPIANDWRTVTVEAPDGTETWAFESNGPRVYLKQHRSSTGQYRYGHELPPLPASVRDEVLRRFRDAVTVMEPSQ